MNTLSPRLALVLALVLRALAPCSVAAAELAPVASTASVSAETPEQHAARMAWWREARFGMFIHWGVYSVPAGTYQGKQIPSIGEWIMLNAKIPVADYASFTKEFNPVKFDAEAWVRLARDAGMKYIVITAKHHDGFAMFHTAVDGFNIFDATPFHRDPLQELAAACQKYGVRLGFYYSQDQDWHHPGGVALKGGHWDPAAQDGDFAAYVHTVALPQVRELLTRYGPVSVLWWDTPTPEMTPDLARELAAVLKLQPGIIQNNRLIPTKSQGTEFKGDTETPEQFIPPQGYPGEDWETCMTMNNTWGFKRDDNNWKSSETLIRNLCDIASKGGNYLLNVGPTSEGLMPQASLDRLADVGKWMAANGEAIYGSGPTPFGAEAGQFSATEKDKKGKPKFIPAWQWRCTTKPGEIYAIIFNWPASGKFELPALKTKVLKATLLAAPDQFIAVTQAAANVALSLPEHAPDAVASVVRLDLADKNVEVQKIK